MINPMNIPKNSSKDLMSLTKYLIFPVAALLILHLSLVYYQKKEDLQLLKDRTSQFQRQIEQLESKKAISIKKLESYILIYKDLKPWLLTGFEDPEKGLVKFLDYLNPSLLDGVNANINIQNSNISKRHPIPLQQSSFMIDFSFLYTHEIENFLSRIFLQDQYPIKVKTAKIHRQKEARTKAEVSFDLLIPVNLRQLELDEIDKI